MQVNVGCDAIVEYKNRCSPFAIDILIDIILGEERNLSLSNLKRFFLSLLRFLCVAILGRLSLCALFG